MQHQHEEPTPAPATWITREPATIAPTGCYFNQTKKLHLYNTLFNIIYQTLQQFDTGGRKVPLVDFPF